MAHELEVDDILLRRPERRRNVHRRPKRRKNNFAKFTMFLSLVILVFCVVFAFADVGGDIILNMAGKFLSENYGISLKAEKLTGNPVKGYTLHNFNISDENGRKFLSAESLSAHLSFPAILTGKLNFVLTDSRLLLHDIGVFEIENITADLNNFTVNVDSKFNGLPVKGNIDLEKSTGLKTINRAVLSLGSGKIEATGGLIDDKFDFHASVEDLNAKEITALYPSILISRDFEGLADLNADVTGKIDAPKISGMIDYKGSKIYGFPVERFSTNFNYSDYRISLNNLQANALNIPVQGEIAAAKRPNEKISVMIKLDGSETNLNGLDKALKIPELKKLSGKVSAFNANISGYIDSLSGLVNFTAPKIAYDGRALTNIKAQLKLAKSDTANVDGKFNFEGANGYLNGTIASILINPKMNLTAKIADLDIKRVENMIPDASDYKLAGKITASVNVKGTTSNPSISGSITSPQFSGWEQTIIKPVINFSFADKTLTLSKTEGTLNGMPINLSGTVKDIPSSDPELDINATVSTKPSSLKNYVPDIDQYSLKGTVNAGLKIKGRVSKPSVEFTVSSKSLEAMDIIKAEDLELTTAMNGDLTKLEKINVRASAKSINASGVTFSNITANLDKNSDKIILGSISAKNGEGIIKGSGNASISGKTPLDFNFKFDDLALSKLASASGLDIKGNLSGTLKISGSNKNPSINFDAKIPSLKAMEGNISGNADFNFKLTGDGGKISGSGELTSTGIKAWGMELTGVKLPLTYSGNNFSSNNGTAKLYGGKLKNTFNFDINAMKFSDSMEASGVDTNALIQDVTGGLEGKITGIGKLTMKINGSVKDKTTYSGSGNFSMGSGAVTGFKWLDVFSKIHNSNGLRYLSVNAPLSLQTGKLILQSGSIIKANNKDPIYTYAKLSQNGTIDFSGKDVTMNLMTESNVNYQLINAIQGGSVGGFSALFKGGASSFEDGLKTFLSKGFENAEKVASTGDFRIVKLKISGKAVSPTFSSLNIGASTLKQTQNANNNKNESLKEKVIDRAVDMVVPKSVKKDIKENIKTEINKLLPDNKTNNATTTKTPKRTVRSTSSKDNAKKEVKKVIDNNKEKIKEIQENVKDNLKKEIEKGLGGLFKR